MGLKGVYQVLIESLTILLLSSLYTMGFDISAKWKHYPFFQKQTMHHHLEKMWEICSI
jgi:hypothetical protein